MRSNGSTRRTVGSCTSARRAMHWLLLLALVVLGRPVHAERSTPVNLVDPAAAANNRFGHAVAVDGDTMVVGSPSAETSGESGTAQVYRWSGSGWTFEALLTGFEVAAGDRFGAAVDVVGDVVIVGAPLTDGPDGADQGAAHIFTRTGTTWTQQGRLEVAGTSHFGSSVAIWGDTALVGSERDTIGDDVERGSAHVFVRSGNAWSHQARLVGSDASESDFFGTSVDIDGDTAIIGAPGFANQGTAYVFTRRDGGWSEQARIAALDGQIGDRFASSVSLVGDTAIIGAPNSSADGAGSAYVFVRAQAAWNQQAKLIDPVGTAGDAFGSSVAVDGDTALVGAYLDRVGDGGAQGSAHAFVRFGSTWSYARRLSAPDARPGDWFGSGVALFGDTAVVGCSGDDVGTTVDQGSAWIFTRFDEAWIGPDQRILPLEGSYGQFGSSAAISGDTAVIGAFRGERAYVYVRTSDGWTRQGVLAASDGTGQDYFGCAVAISGDTVVVGAFGDDVGTTSDLQQGAAYVFVRTGTTWTQQAKLIAPSSQEWDYFGSDVAIVGDTIVVGAHERRVGESTAQGIAYVFERSGTTWTETAQLVDPTGYSIAHFGYSVAMMQDTIIVGAPGGNWQTQEPGSAHVFVRDGAGWTHQAKLVAAAPNTENFGFSVSISGDTAAVGMRFTDGGGPGTIIGAAYVFVRSGTTWTQQARLISPDSEPRDAFGSSVSVLGDRLIVGAFLDLIGENDWRGSAYLYVRSGTQWLQQHKFIIPDGVYRDGFGLALAFRGDLVIIGAAGYDWYRGAAYSFDVPEDDFALARNDTTGAGYHTIAEALAAAQSGERITATEAAWREMESASGSGRSLEVLGSGDIRTTHPSSLEVAGSSRLAAATGGVVELNSQFVVSGGADVNVDASRFRLGSRGHMTARQASNVSINAPEAILSGPTRVGPGASLACAGRLTTLAPTTSEMGGSLRVGELFTNVDAFTMAAGTISTHLLWNRAHAEFVESCAIQGDFMNEAGAACSIRGGTLLVNGMLTSNGAVVGSACEGCSSPGLDVALDLTLGAGAELRMPIAGSLVRVAGDVDSAIDDHARFDLARATLRVGGGQGDQAFEVMSRDIGPDARGLDRAIAGHYPIAKLEIGPEHSVVRLVDGHDNDGLGQASCEAIYVNELVIHEGSRLANTSCKIYCNTLVNNGAVDVAENVVRITIGACLADVDRDGAVTTADVGVFFAAYEAGADEADVDIDGGVTGGDLAVFFEHFEAGC